MPIRNFRGETLVGFLDISGFKSHMRQRGRALEILNLFYQIGYTALRVQSAEHNCRVEGIFVTDCAILFVRHRKCPIDRQLRALLEVVEGINRRLISQNIMLTTSITHGFFSYEPRREFQGIEKNIVFGDAYLNAYLDNSIGTPKLTPWLCRIVIDRLPPHKVNDIISSDDPLFQRLRHRTDKHLYFYWMLSDPKKIKRFERSYASPLEIPNYPPHAKRPSEGSRKVCRNITTHSTGAESA